MASRQSKAQPEEGGGRGPAKRVPDPEQPVREGALQVLELAAPVAAPPVLGMRWKRLFDGRDARELIGRFADGDPLGLWTRCARWVQRRRYIVHLDRLHLRAVARAAIRGMLYTGKPKIEDWLEERVEESLRDLLIEDTRAEFEGQVPRQEDLWQHAMMVEVFGVEPHSARRAAVTFNRLPLARRRVLFALTFQGLAIDACVSAGLGTRSEVESHAQAGLEALSRLDTPTLRDLLTLEAEL